MDCSKISTVSKIRLVFAVLILNFSALKAQTWSEFFEQKSTQRRYLTEQLIALKVYAGYLEKGYKIAGEGIGLVEDFKNGEFGFHDIFFRSLKTASPLISRNPRLLSMIAMEHEIFRISVRGYDDELFSPAEMSFIEGVKNDLSKSISADLESLSAILETGKLEMSEDERLSAFNRLYDKVCESYRSAASFDASVRLLLAQKTKSLKELKNMEDIQ